MLAASWYIAKQPDSAKIAIEAARPGRNAVSMSVPQAHAAIGPIHLSRVSGPIRFAKTGVATAAPSCVAAISRPACPPAAEPGGVGRRDSPRYPVERRQPAEHQQDAESTVTEHYPYPADKLTQRAGDRRRRGGPGAYAEPDEQRGDHERGGVEAQRGSRAEQSHRQAAAAAPATTMARNVDCMIAAASA